MQKRAEPKISIKGKVLILVGAKGMGKTSFVRDMLSKVPPKNRMVYDVNAEYTDLYQHDLEQSYEEFLEESVLVRDAFVVYEEATIFVGHSSNSRQIKELLVRTRHTGNTVVFVFHSLRTVPRFVFDLSNFVILFKTADTVKLVEKNFDNEAFTQVFKEIQAAPMLKGKTRPYSPHKVFEVQ